MRYYDVFLQHNDLSTIIEQALPEAYTYCFYEEGMQKDWVAIQLHAKQIKNEEEGNILFTKTFMPYHAILKERMLFIKNKNNESIATATAFLLPNDATWGKLHWIAICEKEQGKGLGKALLSKTLCTLHELGYKKCMLHTQTTNWIALQMYLQYGFTPLFRNEYEEAWQYIESKGIK